MSKSLIPLLGAIQKYSWGILGEASLAGRFSKQKLDPATPYAELWFGAHPSAPAKHLSDGVSLVDWIKQDPAAALGKRVVERFGVTIPFLVKILSVAKPLSIQSHPNLEQAKLLHARNPKQYPDANHKPEMSIALTSVEILYGFRPLSELRRNALQVPELRALVGEEVTQRLLGAKGSEVEEALRAYFCSLMKASEESISQNSLRLLRRLKSEAVSATEKWIVRAAVDFPAGDVGLFCFYLLNLIQLKPGDALFIDANIPHAYLSGEMLEVMANSDNVMRAGLTPKFRDSDSLSEMLRYVPIDEPGKQLLTPEETSSGSIFKTTAEEFVVEIIERSCTLQADSVEILIALSGQAVIDSADGSTHIRAGEAYLVASNSSQISITNPVHLQLARIRVP